jgi:hypothetical protein
MYTLVRPIDFYWSVANEKRAGESLMQLSAGLQYLGRRSAETEKPFNKPGLVLF